MCRQPTTKTSRWDTSEVLKTDEDIQVYLEISYESGDPKLISKALDNVAKAKAKWNI